jgi:hypothetical protein
VWCFGTWRVRQKDEFITKAFALASPTAKIRAPAKWGAKMGQVEKFDWKQSLQKNYLLVAASIFLAGATGALTAYATMNDFIERRFNELVKDKSLASKTDVQKSELPKDTVGVFLNACPDGWRDFQQATGRYLVIAGAVQQQLVGTQVGQKLEGAENRPAGLHTHGYLADEHANEQGTVPMKFQSPGGGHMPTVARATDGGSGLKAETNAPFIFVTGCLKN